MRATWAAAALMAGLVACGFYDAVPRPSSPLVPDVGLPDAGLPELPDGGGGTLPDGGGRPPPDGGFQLPDGGFQLPDGGFQLPDGGFQLPDGGTLPDAGADAGAAPPCPPTTCVQEAFVTGEGRPMQLGLTASHVYWVNMEGATLRRAPKAGGAGEVLSYQPLRAPLQVDEGAPYFVAEGSGGPDTLTRLPYGVSAGTALASWPTQLLAVGALAQNAASLFAETPDGLVQAQKDGSGARVRWGGAGTRAGLAADGDGAYFSDRDTGLLLRLDPRLSSNGYAVLADLSPELRVERLHAGGGMLYASLVNAVGEGCGTALLVRVPTRGGGLSLVSQSPGCILDLATDGTHVYWLADDPAQGLALRRAPLAGGPAWQLGLLSGQSWSLAVDASHVYWSEPNLGRIMRMAKP